MNIQTTVSEALDAVVEKIEEEVRKDVVSAVTDWAENWVHHHSRRTAVSAQLVINPIGGSMPGSITVDTTNETVTLEFVDDKGDTNAAAPSNASGSAVVTFTSDTPSVVTVATDSTNPLQGDITVVGEGTANVGATLAYPDGTAVVEADGVTPFPVPAPVLVTVGPGAAVGDALVLSV